MNLVLNQLFCFITVFLYNTYSEEDSLYEMPSAGSPNDESPSFAPSFAPSQITPTLASSIQESPSALPLVELVIALFLISMISFVVFFRLINPEYIKTFYDSRTAKRFITDRFKIAATDVEIFETFQNHPSLYSSIDVELAERLETNWDKLEEEQPVWFTAAAIASVPSRLLPARVIESMGGLSGRKASIAAMKEEVKQPVKDRKRRGSDLKIRPMG